MMPEDRAPYFNDEEAMLLASTLRHTRQLLYDKIFKIASRSLVSVHIIPDLHNRLRRYIDDSLMALMNNREKKDEAAYVDNLIAYLLVHRTYMAHQNPDLWGRLNDEDF